MKRALLALATCVWLISRLCRRRGSGAARHGGAHRQRADRQHQSRPVRCRSATVLLALQKIDFKNAFAFDRADAARAAARHGDRCRPPSSTAPPPSAAHCFARCSVIWRLRRSGRTSSRSMAIPAGSTRTTSSRRTGSSRSRPTACRLVLGSRGRSGCSTRARPTSSLTMSIMAIGSRPCSTSASAIDGA